MRIPAIATLGFGLVALTVGCAAPRTISTRTLLAEMTALTTLAESPEPPYTFRQASSYDRRSTTPADAETWFANDDCNQFLRIDERDGRQEWVMLDVDGPGALVRIWSANPGGNIRIYLDHADTPVVVAPMNDFLHGNVAGFPEPIAHQRSKGWNTYFPIAYAKHCKVTSDAGGFYYHVNYRTYLAGTRVISFSSHELAALHDAVEHVAELLRSPRESGVATAERLPMWATRTELFAGVELPPGRALVKSLPRKGPGAVAGLAARVESKDVVRACRGLLLSIRFDGRETVACPLGDFFGAGPGIRPYASLPLGIDADGTLWCNWVMPYRVSAEITIRNVGPEPAHVWLTAVDQPYAWSERSMHFHAGWAVERDYPTRPFSDWNYVTVAGQGVYVGSAFTIANPVKAWWGEGDEKMYVDGEEFPGHFGTGTEDYFGYAWCWPEPFTHAYHAQPQCDGPGNYGRTAINRWHILDRIPFARNLRFDMEIWHWWDGRLPEFSVVTYWYARPGASDNRPAPQPADMALAELPAYVARRVSGAIEGEELQIVAQTGLVEPQDIDNCSNDKHLWWRDGQPGDQLVLSFPIATAGRYRVMGRFVNAKDYGIVQLKINDEAASKPFDLYHDGVVVADEVALGVFGLQAGENRLVVEIGGANERAVPKYMFGLDYLRLQFAD